MIPGPPAELDVLIVEDDPATAELERRALVRAGKRVRIVGRVETALEALAAESFAAVLLDYQLPDGSPWAVFEAARRALPPIPVILVTAGGDERIAAEVLRRGGADYVIKKDAFWEQLGAAVDRVIRLARIEQANVRLVAMVESSEDAIINRSLQGEILTWNAGAERIFGYSSAEAVGRPVSILAPEGRAEEEAAIMEQLRSGFATRQFETVRRRRDGGLVEVSLTVSPIFGAEGQVTGGADITRDISERRRVERGLAIASEQLRESEDQLRQAQKMDAIGQLAGGIAHDFNNLLSVINGYAELLLERFDREAYGYRQIGEIAKAGERASGLTRQLLAFSRQREVETRVLELNSIITDMTEMLERLIGEHIELVTALSEVAGRVKADTSQIEQVLMNLVVNARDAMSDGGRLCIETANVTLDEDFVGSHPGFRPGDYVRLVVSDTGTGMDAAIRARIFEPFFTTKEVGRGTGLGLATVFGIVEQSGGHIYVYSEPGRGSSFKVYLPRVEAAVSPAPAAASAEPRERGSETLLVVEDEPQLRTLICMVLEDAGYTAIEAAGPKQALEIAENADIPVDLLITDVVMPGKGGPALAAEIARLRPGIKALFVSGYTGRTVTRSGHLDPQAHFLEKPFTSRKLLSKVREVLEAKAH